MSHITERYRPVPLGVNASYTVRSQALGFFLAKTAGTITVTNYDGTVLVDAVGVTAGVYLPIPILLMTPKNAAGGTVTLGGGASGTLGVG
jgi:hypothetical protein